MTYIYIERGIYVMILPTTTRDTNRLKPRCVQGDISAYCGCLARTGTGHDRKKHPGNPEGGDPFVKRLVEQDPDGELRFQDLR